MLYGCLDEDTCNRYLKEIMQYKKLMTFIRILIFVINNRGRWARTYLEGSGKLLILLVV